MIKSTLTVVLLLFVSILYGQKKVNEGEKLVFVYYKNKPHNLIVIPNTGKFKSFKIYRKLPTDSAFVQVAEKKKPLLPMRYNITPYAVTWEDDTNSSREIEYRIYAFDKNDEQICEMKLFWDGDKNPIDNKQENSN